MPCRGHDLGTFTLLVASTTTQATEFNRDQDDGREKFTWDPVLHDVLQDVLMTRDSSPDTRDEVPTFTKK